MKGWKALVGIMVVVLTFSGVFVSAQETARERSQGLLEMYRAVVDPPTAAQLRQDGYDIASARNVAGGVQLDLVLSQNEYTKLVSQGIQLNLWRNKDGETATQLASKLAQDGFDVWKPFDGPGGLREVMDTIATDYPDLVKTRILGKSIQGRDIVALKVTADANNVDDGTRPAVLYFSLQHAREWVAGEVNLRLLRYILENATTDDEIEALLQSTELWVVLVVNPDGYQYTFAEERLWRKNLRDNDGDGEITGVDGVDPNRNWASPRWGYDEEGADFNVTSNTYRGTAPASEPEIQAMQGLIEDVDFSFMIDYHSYGPLILYPLGWQVQTPSVDDPIFVALAGTDENPAIAGSDPGVGADLYITNGDSTDYAYTVHDVMGFTVELGEGGEDNGFIFPDDEALIQQEFEINIPFALDLAKSAADPTQPVSHLGNTVEPFYPDAFAVSYGDPQIVQTKAARSLGDITLTYQINGGAVQSVPTTEWEGGERWGGGGVYYKAVRGEVTDTEPGDVVTVSFTGGGETSETFTYTATVESESRVLVVAAEDYTGISPEQEEGPQYLSYYLDALEHAGLPADVYDVDANERQAPNTLGVLSHYDAVVWYTGDDIITREPDMQTGTVSRLANDLMLEMRSYLNEGGKLLHTGKYAGFQYAGGYVYDPVENAPCGNEDEVDARCVPLSNDFLQYYLGAYIYNSDLGTIFDEEGSPVDLYRVDAEAPFSVSGWAFNGIQSAGNQDHSASFIATSGILPADDYPQFASSVGGKYGRRAFAPNTGNYYVYSGQADVSYKRLTRTIDLTDAVSGTLSFWVSRNIEPDWDYFFVEAHAVGEDDWTTLPDQNEHTATDTGQSCVQGWQELHPFLARYQTFTPGDGSAPGSCSPTGTTGEWHAATGNSSGWEQWEIDLSAYAGKQVEVSLSYVSDWGSQGLGVFIDDVAISTGELTSFEEDLGGWEVTGPPPESAPNPNDFERITGTDFPEGAVMVTEDTLYFGFGFEGIAGRSRRLTVMRDAMDYLLGPSFSPDIPYYLPITAN